MSEYRLAALKAVKANEVTKVFAAMIQAAAAGDPSAAKLLLDRLFGKNARALLEAVESEDDWGEAIDLPAIDSPRAVADASARIREAYSAGLISGKRSERLLATIHAEAEAASFADLAERFEAMEETLRKLRE